MHLANCIIKALEKGTIKTVLLFSDTYTMPEPPYVVVKPENGAIANTRQYRIIVHHLAGLSDDLEKYAMAEIDQLLPSFLDVNEGGEKSRFKLYKGGYTDITAEPFDNTFFMERIFYTPLPGHQ